MPKTSSGPIKLLLDSALASGVNVEDAPSTWVGDRFNSEAFENVHRAPTAERANRDLPKTVFAVRLERTPVLLGELDSPAHRQLIQDTLRRYRNQAAITRSWLGPDALNLHLFLVGPAGSAANALWRHLAAEIEMDDLVCRKLVWLPTQEPSARDVHLFLSRTFLARPWESGPEPASTQLDRMSDVALPAGWVDVIDDADLDPDDLVAKLIELDEGASP